MGRKKKEFPPSKEMNFHFRMTKELYEVLQTEAASADMTLSDYVRKLLTSRKPIIKKRIEVVFNDPEILQIFRNLGACGNNLNQIAAYDYLTTKHDEFTSKPILDKNGKRIPRESFIIEGINCDPTSFGRECEDLNLRYGKNKKNSEIKAHHYIISFDPRDRDDNGLTPKQAQALGMEFAQKNFPEHQTLVYTHPDGHNSVGNIHVHITINSVRAFDVTRQDFIKRLGDSLAGHKHHVTKDFLEYLKSETMLMCQQQSSIRWIF